MKGNKAKTMITELNNKTNNAIPNETRTKQTKRKQNNTD